MSTLISGGNATSDGDQMCNNLPVNMFTSCFPAWRHGRGTHGNQESKGTLRQVTPSPTMNVCFTLPKLSMPQWQQCRQPPYKQDVYLRPSHTAHKLYGAKKLTRQTIVLVTFT